MQQIQCCHHCEKRKRVINEDGTVWDCHSHCEEYLALAKKRAEQKAQNVADRNNSYYSRSFRLRNNNHYSKLGTIEQAEKKSKVK